MKSIIAVFAFLFLVSCAPVPVYHGATERMEADFALSSDTKAPSRFWLYLMLFVPLWLPV